MPETQEILGTVITYLKKKRKKTDGKQQQLKKDRDWIIWECLGHSTMFKKKKKRKKKDTQGTDKSVRECGIW